MDLNNNNININDNGNTNNNNDINHVNNINSCNNINNINNNKSELLDKNGLEENMTRIKLNHSNTTAILNNTTTILNNTTTTLNNTNDLNDTVLAGMGRAVCDRCSCHHGTLKYLSCLHLYCPPCIQAMLLNSGEQSCAVCVRCGWRQLIGDDLENLHEDAVNRNLEMLVTNSIEAPFDKVACTLCKPDNVRGDAVVFCASCPPLHASLCQECMDAHVRMNRFREHQLTHIKLHQLKNFFHACPKHPGMKISILCRTCKKSQCPHCCQESCFKHEVVNFEGGVERVEELVKEFQESGIEALNMLPRLQGKAEEVGGMLVKMDVDEKCLQEEIDKDFERAIFLLKVRKMELIQELTTFYQDKKIFLQGVAREHQRSMTECAEALKQIERHRLFASRFDECNFENTFESKLKISEHKLQDFKVRGDHFNMRYSRKQDGEVFRGLSQAFGDLSLSSDGIENSNDKRSDTERLRLTSIASQPMTDSKASTPDTTSSVSSQKHVPSDKQSIKTNHNGNKNGSSSSNHNGDKSWKKRLTQGRKISAACDAKSESSHSQGKEVEDIFSKADMFQSEDTSYKSVQCVNTKGGVTRKKIYCKLSFGEEGDQDHQFLEPGGVCSNKQSEIIVADANNHQVKIFDVEGRLLKSIGGFDKKREAEKKKFLMESEGMSAEQAAREVLDDRDPDETPLVYPNRVFVCPLTGNIVVTERTPTNRVQVVSREGIYLCEFGRKLISHPRGVTVDSYGNILVLESKVNRVLIFSEHGKLKKKFYISQADFPNSIAVNKFNEVFVADNKRHCVHVFAYNGDYVRQIGGTGTTNYPISVCIGEHQEVLVMDNHTNFNVTMFTRQGDLLAAVQSDFKHNQCYDACVTPNGYVIVSTRDHKIHVYSLPSYFSKLATDGVSASTTNGEHSVDALQTPLNQRMNGSASVTPLTHNLLQQSSGQMQFDTREQMINSLELQSTLNQLSTIPQWSHSNSPLNIPLKWRSSLNANNNPANQFYSNYTNSANHFYSSQEHINSSSSNVYNNNNPFNNNIYNNPELLATLLSRQLLQQHPNEASLRGLLTTHSSEQPLFQQALPYPHFNNEQLTLFNNNIPDQSFPYNPAPLHDPSPINFSPFQGRIYNHSLPSTSTERFPRTEPPYHSDPLSSQEAFFYTDKDSVQTTISNLRY